MNETIAIGNEISTITQNPKEVIDIIAKNMLKTRPKGEVVYRAYTHNTAVYQDPKFYVDFSKFYPNAQVGDVAYAHTILTAPSDAEMLISVFGKVKVWFDGELCEGDFDGEALRIPVQFKQGTHKLLIKCVNDGENFSIKLIVSVPRYPHLWACDYLYCARATVPIEGFENESGMAVTELYSSNNVDSALSTVFPPENGELNYIFPQIGNKSKDNFDFNELLGDGMCAYAFTNVCGDVLIKHTSPLSIFLDGEIVYSNVGVGQYKVTSSTSKQLLVKCLKGENAWGFKADYNKGACILPFVEFSGEKQLNWLWLGPFGNDRTTLEMPFKPEYQIDFDKPYTNGENVIFWRFNRPDTYLRPYLDTSFFGQWFYALMVGQYGLNVVAHKYYNSEYYKYFTDSTAVMVKYFELMLFEKEVFGCPTFLFKTARLVILDNIGTMGMNIVDYYNQTGDDKALPIIQKLAENALTVIPRFEDGTYRRIDTMWADDLFMSLPFLVRLGRLFKDNKYYDEVVKQAQGFAEKLYMEDKKIYSHILFTDTNLANRVPWGRGNGWIFFALSEALLYLPKDYEGREIVLKLFNDFAEGLANFIDESGLWHQVIDHEESYLETSGTGMFVIGLARGVKHGWLPTKYAEFAKKGYFGLLNKSVDKDGNVYGVCMGSGRSMEAKYYLNIPTFVNDDHGTGVVLIAAAEIADLLD